MIIAVCLLLYSLLILVAGPRLLSRLTQGGQAPRLGVAAWISAISSVLISTAAALVAVGAQIVAHWDHRQYLLASCVAQLRVIATGQAGAWPQIALLGLGATAAVAIGVTALRLANAFAGMRRKSRDYAEAVHLVGRRTSAPDVRVLDADQPAAYCVAGRRSTIVVTSAAIAALDEQQLGAVLAHERAHLAGHHPHLVASLRGLASVFPRLTLMTEGAKDVSRLLEMCADDVAARRHGREALLNGLLAMSGAVPAGALAAADVAVLERAQRLTGSSADRFIQAGRTAALISAIAAISAGPVSIAALAASGALMCGM
ncbi:MAG: M56 family metallopeptidase [Actinomycetia bacterium]|nr:M56 family metallopeptidase [Actinomycetes bacterium]MCH9759398.1 M56 family metallopeptidase [Actinomycetes bacterium]